MTLASPTAAPPISPAALRAARIARRLARLLRLHRLHRARRDGDRRRRLVLAQPHRRARARGPRHPGRRSGVHADPPRGHRRRTQASSTRTRPGLGRRHDARDGAHRRRPHRAGRAQGGRWRLSAVRHGGARSRHAARRALAQRDGAFGAAVDPRLLARLDLKPGARLTIGDATIEITAAIRTEPDKLAAGIGFGPRVIVSEEALRATGLLVPGSLVRWHYRLRLPDGSDRAADAVIAAASAQLPGRRLADPHPHQRVAGAGAQRRALHPVPHAGRPDRAAGRRRRRRQRGEEPHRPQARRDRDPEGARRDRRPRVRDLSLAGAAAVGGRRRDRARGRRGDPAVRHRGGVRRHHPAADRAGAASRPSWRWRSSTACSRRSPSRSGRSAAPMTCRSRRCFAMRSRRGGRWPRRRYVVATGAGGRGARDHRRDAVLRPQDRGDLRRRRGRGVRHAPARRAAADGDRAPAAAARARPRCGSPSPTSTGRAR